MEFFKGRYGQKQRGKTLSHIISTYCPKLSYVSVSLADKRLVNLGRPAASFGFEFQFGSEIRHWASFTWFQVSLEKGEMDEEEQVAVRRQLQWKIGGCEQQRRGDGARIANRKHRQVRSIRIPEGRMLLRLIRTRRNWAQQSIFGGL